MLHKREGKDVRPGLTVNIVLKAGATLCQEEGVSVTMLQELSQSFVSLVRCPWLPGLRTDMQAVEHRTSMVCPRLPVDGED
jgi:hypothetical protein